MIQSPAEQLFARLGVAIAKYWTTNDVRFGE